MSAKDLLADAVATAGRFRPLIEAARVRLSVLYEGYSGDVVLDVSEPEGLSPELAATVHVVRAAALLIRGSVMAAEEELSAVDPHSLGAEWAD